MRLRQDKDYRELIAFHFQFSDIIAEDRQVVRDHTGLLKDQAKQMEEIGNAIHSHHHLLNQMQSDVSVLAELNHQVDADHDMLLELKSEVSSLSNRVNAIIANDDSRSKDDQKNDPDPELGNQVSEIAEKLDQMRKKIQETDHLIFEVKEKIRRMDEESVDDREARDKNMRRLRDRVESLAGQVHAGPGRQRRRDRH
jgi:DNA repair exonuclease SbcCD ATPase subunit